MFKIIGSIMIGISCIYLGLRRSLRLKKRYKYLKNIQNSLELLETEISLKSTRISEAFKDIHEKTDTCSLFKTAAELITDNGIAKAWSKSVHKNALQMCLSDGDVGALIILGQRLGMTDTETQVKNINSVKNILDINIKSAKYDVEHFCRLYSGGGVLAGVFIVLMLL